MEKTREGLAGVLEYPLMSALVNRRSRRVARGTSIHSGPLSYKSQNKSAPLTPLEEAVLIVATGLTGITTHDGPLAVPTGGRELGTPFLNTLARSASSPDNSQPTRFFMINDEGIWLLRRLKGSEGLELMKALPPQWKDWSEADWLGVAEAVKQKISDKRLEFPREYPFYLGWNKQLSNRPGTTMFLPVVDATRMYINGILNLSSEPDGQRPLFLDDWRSFHPRSWVDWFAWIGAHLGIKKFEIPYQPIGGVERIRGGFVNKDIPLPLGIAGPMFADHEAYFLEQNLMLVAQAMGLGAWIHVCVQKPYILDRDEGKGWHGLGFRFENPKKEWSRWPPPPSNRPNPVGLGEFLKGLCPPYVSSMSQAVDRLLEEKYATYEDAAIFGRAYRDPANATHFVREAARYSEDTVLYAKEICNYIWETYGRFPAHVDAWVVPGTWVQICHIELEYYEKFFDPPLYERQAEHASLWRE